MISKSKPSYGKLAQKVEQLEQQVATLEGMLNPNIDYKLAESEEKYRLLYESAGLGIGYYSTNGQVIGFNETAACNMGGKPEDFCGKHLYELFPKKQAEEYFRRINAAIVSKEPISYQDEVVLPSRTFWFLSTYTRVVRPHGEVIGVQIISQDISEQKKAEQDLRASEKKYRLYFEHAPIGYQSLDSKGNILEVNNAWLELLGYKQNEVVGQGFGDFLHLHQKEAFQRLLPENIQKPGIIQDLEILLRGKQGKYITTEFTVNFEFDALGDFLRTHCVFRDISERKAAQGALNEKLKQINLINANIPNVIWKTDIDEKGNFINGYISEIVDEFLKLEKGTINNSWHKYVEYIEPEFIPYAMEQIKKGSSAPGTFVSLEYQVKKGNGETAWFSSKGQALFENNKLTIYGSTIDISARKKSEQQILQATEKLKNQNLELIKAKNIAQESEARFKALHNASFGGIAIHDKGIILDCNLGLSTISGYSHAELIGMDGLTLLSPEDREKVMANILSEYEKPYEAEGIRKNGERYPLRLEARMIPYKGKVARTVEFRDISESKKAENELLIAKERAEESDRLKSAFLANMSHEIRTPMNGILGFANLLKEPNLTGEQQLKYVGIIEKSGERMLNIINDLIDISKIEAGQMEVVLTETNIREQCEYLFTFFKPEVEGKGMQLSFNKSLPASEIILNTDREKVYAVLINLIKNAVKYSEKGTIEFGVSTSSTSSLIESTTKLKKDTGPAATEPADTEPAEVEVEFYVKDTGIGIAKDRQEAIFERFIQADIANKNAYQGAGLGLSISKAYVEMLGGKIWVESELGIGSTFYFTLPLQTEIPKENSVKKEILPPAEVGSVNKLKILIVDDDETSEDLLSIAVEKIGSEILHARTGIEAVTACRDNPDIDLVLMDIAMPGMNGYEATREIREFNKDVIIIAQTAYALQGDKEKALKAGCNDYISKPIDKLKLHALIRKHI